VREVVEQMAAGIDAAHAAGVIHRDLKCENVMLAPEGAGTRVVITDFGLARPVDGPARWLRSTGGDASGGARSGSRRSVAGTIGYMAPEQLLGQPTGRACDIYALGVMSFELITGELPFHLKDLLVSGAGAWDGRRRSPRWEPNRLPPVWDAAIRRCLEFAPDARFQRAIDLVRALDGGKRVPAARRILTRRIAAALSACVAVASVGAMIARGAVPSGGRAGSAGSPPPPVAACGERSPREDVGPARAPAAAVSAIGGPVTWSRAREEPTLPAKKPRRSPQPPSGRAGAPAREVAAPPMASAKEAPAEVEPGDDELVYPFSSRSHAE